MPVTPDIMKTTFNLQQSIVAYFTGRPHRNNTDPSASTSTPAHPLGRSPTHAHVPPRPPSSESGLMSTKPSTRTKRKTSHVEASATPLDLPMAPPPDPPAKQRRRIASHTKPQHISSMPFTVCRELNAVSTHACFDFAAFSCIFRTQHGLRPAFEYHFSFEPNEPLTGTLSTNRINNNTSTPLAHIHNFDKHIANS
jgi:hypothetical protein